jgi:hypothetical protein
MFERHRGQIFICLFGLVLNIPVEFETLRMTCYISIINTPLWLTEVESWVKSSTALKLSRNLNTVWNSARCVPSVCYVCSNIIWRHFQNYSVCLQLVKARGGAVCKSRPHVENSGTHWYFYRRRMSWLIVRCTSLTSCGQSSEVPMHKGYVTQKTTTRRMTVCVIYCHSKVFLWSKLLGYAT